MIQDVQTVQTMVVHAISHKRRPVVTGEVLIAAICIATVAVEVAPTAVVVPAAAVVLAAVEVPAAVVVLAAVVISNKSCEMFHLCNKFTACNICWSVVGTEESDECGFASQIHSLSSPINLSRVIGSCFPLVVCYSTGMGDLAADRPAWWRWAYLEL